VTSWLVTGLGIDLKPARYTLHERSVEAPLAPLALVQLLPTDHRPARVLALCTAEAKEKNWPILGHWLAGSEINAAIVEIGADPTDVTSFLRVVTTAIPAESATHIQKQPIPDPNDRRGFARAVAATVLPELWRTGQKRDPATQVGSAKI
jgi:hypothetical protein